MMKRLMLCGLLLAMSCAHSDKTPPVPEAQPAAPATGKPESEPAAQKATEATPAVAPAGSAPAQPGQPVAAPKPRPPKIKIIVRSNPPKANVFWGKKLLGPTPVTLERPRDSGPVDLIVRSDGFFPLHTRAYTFRNDAIYVKLTKLEDRMTLFGAKHDAVETPQAPPGSEGEAPPAPTAPAAAPAN